MFAFQNNHNNPQSILPSCSLNNRFHHMSHTSSIQRDCFQHMVNNKQRHSLYCSTCANRSNHHKVYLSTADKSEQLLCKQHSLRRHALHDHRLHQLENRDRMIDFILFPAFKACIAVHQTLSLLASNAFGFLSLSSFMRSRLSSIPSAKLESSSSRLFLPFAHCTSLTGSNSHSLFIKM